MATIEGKTDLPQTSTIAATWVVGLLATWVDGQA